MTIMNMKIWQIKCHKHKSTKVEILADFPCFNLKISSNFCELEILDFLNCCNELPRFQQILPFQPCPNTRRIKGTKN